MASGSSILGGHRRVNAAADVEITDDGHRFGAAGLHEIVQNLVNDRFMERPFVTIRPKVKLERFELHAQVRRHITNPDGGKIRLSRARADAGKFGALHRNLKVPLRMRVGKSLQLFARLSGHIARYLNAARILFQLFAWLEEKAMRTGSYGLALCFYFVFILFCFVPH
jgi:hypothetical protein